MIVPLLRVAEIAFITEDVEKARAFYGDVLGLDIGGEAMSVNSLGLYLGLAIGPPLSEVLVRTAGFAVAWYGAAATSPSAA